VLAAKVFANSAALFQEITPVMLKKFQGNYFVLEHLVSGESISSLMYLLKLSMSCQII